MSEFTESQRVAKQLQLAVGSGDFAGAFQLLDKLNQLGAFASLKELLQSHIDRWKAGPVPMADYLYRVRLRGPLERLGRAQLAYVVALHWLVKTADDILEPDYPDVENRGSRTVYHIDVSWVHAATIALVSAVNVPSQQIRCGRQSKPSAKTKKIIHLLKQQISVDDIQDRTGKSRDAIWKIRQRYKDQIQPKTDES